MARPANAILWDQWRQRIQRQRESGLSITEFCRREHVSPHSFHVWKRRLRQTPSARHGSRAIPRVQRSQKPRTFVTPPWQPCPAPAQPVLSTGDNARPGTVRSLEASSFLQLPVTAVRPSPWIELALPDGTIVRLPQQNLVALTTVLRVLRGEQVERFPSEDGHA